MNAIGKNTLFRDRNSLFSLLANIEQHAIEISEPYKGLPNFQQSDLLIALPSINLVKDFIILLMNNQLAS